MSAAAHQSAIKLLANWGDALWLIADHERKCCAEVEPGEQCAHKSACSQREHCPATELCVVRFAARRCQAPVAVDAAQHVIDGHAAVVRTDSITWEARQ